MHNKQTNCLKSIGATSDIEVDDVFITGQLSTEYYYTNILPEDEGTIETIMSDHETPITLI